MTTTILIAPCKACGTDIAYVEEFCPECGHPLCSGWTRVAGILDQPCASGSDHDGCFDGDVYRKGSALRLLLLEKEASGGKVAASVGKIVRWAKKDVLPHLVSAREYGVEVFLYLLDGTTCPAQVQMMPVPPGITTEIVSRIEPYPAFFRETGIEEIPGKAPQWKIGRQEKFSIPGAPPATLWQPITMNR